MEYPILNTVDEQNIQQTQEITFIHPLNIQSKGEHSSDEGQKKCNQSGYALRDELVKKIMMSENKMKWLKPRKRRYIKKGHWSFDQSAKYYLFLISNLNNFKTAQLRRLQKIFKEMSLFLGSRTPTQCRSHHQKQQKKYHSLISILQNLYIEVKAHPLLEGQTPFGKNTPEYSDLYEDKMTLEPIVQIPNELDLESKVKKEGPLICYEMPQGLQPISKQKYISLFYLNCSHTLTWLY